MFFFKYNIIIYDILSVNIDFNDDTLSNLPNSLKIIKLYHSYGGNLKCLPKNTKIQFYYY